MTSHDEPLRDAQAQRDAARAALEAAQADPGTSDDRLAELRQAWLQARAQVLQLTAMQGRPGASHSTSAPQSAPEPAAVPGDPARAALREIVVTMSRQLAQVRRTVALAVADERRLARRVEAELARVSQWEERIAMAERTDRRDLLEQARERRAHHTARVRDLEARWRPHQAAVDGLRERLGELEARVQRARQRSDRLVGDARVRRAELLTEATAVVFERILDAQADLEALLRFET